MRQRVADELASRLAHHLDILCEAISIPSVNPAFGGTGEKRVQSFIAARLKDMGACVEMWDVHPGRPNVLATFGGDGPVRVVLNSHVDTAPADLTRWQSDPFSPVVSDGLVRGLGAIDAKGPLTVFVGALDLLQACGVEFRRPIAIASVVDEEAGGSGTVSYLERGQRAEMAVVGEATGMEVCPASRGAFNVKVRLRGQTAHLGRAYEGVNAIEKAIVLLDRMGRLEGELDAWHMHPLWALLPVGHVTTPTHMDVPNPTGGVPDECEITWSVGYLADEAFDDVREKVESAIREAASADGWLAAHPPEVSVATPHIEPCATRADHTLVKAFAHVHAGFGWSAPVVRALSAGTDARHLVALGGIPTVNFGPGALALAHSEHEALPIDDFRRSILTVASVLLELCA